MRKEWAMVLYTLIPVFGAGLVFLYVFWSLVPASPEVILVSWDIGMTINIYFRLKRVFAVRSMLLEVKEAYHCSSFDLCRLLFTMADRYKGTDMTRDEMRACADALFPFAIVTKAIQLGEKEEK